MSHASVVSYQTADNDNITANNTDLIEQQYMEIDNDNNPVIDLAALNESVLERA
jgi:hypothetical protein